MSTFKAGDNIVRVKQGASWAPIGYETTVLKNGKYKDSDSSCKTDIVDEFWELVAPKWSIYNNDLPWEKLSNKQKGKMLLAAHSGVKFEGVVSNPPAFDCEKSPYTAVKPEPETEPTMAELFLIDWQDCEFSLQRAIDCMIAMGWAKSC